jgi:hypothetical protein
MIVMIAVEHEQEHDYEHDTWMGDRVVDCARLESVCAERHRGFESLPIRSAFLLLLLLVNVFRSPAIRGDREDSSNRCSP